MYPHTLHCCNYNTYNKFVIIARISDLAAPSSSPATQDLAFAHSAST